MRNRTGFALLEALIALAILGTAGLSLVAVVQSGLASERRAREEEGTLGTASRVLTALTLLTREDLDQRIGPHPLGEFQIDVARPERTLYRIAIARLDSPGTAMLVTVVSKP
jgi:type II secretory pathway pseudopilin PulG